VFIYKYQDFITLTVKLFLFVSKSYNYLANHGRARLEKNTCPWSTGRQLAEFCWLGRSEIKTSWSVLSPLQRHDLQFKICGCKNMARV